MKTKKQKFEGEFYTPKIWVDEAHKMITEEFGVDWKEKYIVWDCAWGSGNLTRDYNFKELYCSTLNQSDIDKSDANKESIRFQFDFLNDDLNELKYKAPKLLDAINSGKQIIFLINPPYGTVNSLYNIKNGGGKSKNKIEDTLIKKEMNNDKMGLSVKNLYTQFLYRIYKIQKINKNVNISIFAPPLFLTGIDYKIFRNYFFNKFIYKYGMLFNAQHFADVSEWGLSFTIFKNGKNTLTTFNMKVKELNNELNIEELYIKNIYNMDNNIGCNKWVRVETKGIKATEDLPKLSSALKVKQKGYSNLIPNAFGYFYNAGNNIYYNTQNISIFSSCFSNKSGLSIIKQNFLKTQLLFTARKSIKTNWVNQKDEYIAPSEEIQKTKKYKQFNNDSIVYSLFNTSSQQSSMRNIEYKDKLYNIKNEFFWLNKKIMNI